MNLRTIPTDLIARAGRTFAQAFVATITVAMASGINLSGSSVRGIIVGALAAGISAAWNVLFGVPLTGANVTPDEAPKSLPSEG